MGPLVSTQATIHVPADQPTIQAGIEAALNGDTVLVAPGTYVEQIDFLGKAIQVLSEEGAALTTIDSQGLSGWANSPSSPVVRFISGESLSSILEGFTITGCALNNCSGIYAIGADPLILHCVITGNKGGPGAGIRCNNAVIEDTVISNNDSFMFNNFGGGIFGSPSLTRCTVTRNTADSEGGGIYSVGSMTIVDSVISSNSTPLCYTGAGIYISGGTVTIVDSLLTGNWTCQFDIFVLNEYGAAIGGPGAINLSGCTIADNTVFGQETDPTNPSAALDVSSGTIVDTILWNNLPGAFSASFSPTTSYSNVEGGASGTGNIDADPLLDAAYFPQPSSPGIDLGDPAGALDPDGTPGDMGAFYFPQFLASSSVRNGTGLNPLCLTELAPAQIGGTWTVQVATNAHGFPGTLSTLVVLDGSLASLILSFGELLVDPTSSLLVASTVSSGGGSTATHSIAIPLDYSIGGLVVFSQALITGGGVGLCNALDVTLGL